ncbi:hypothetical protein Y1Q_0011519 [Alligator mississippiensis]|uniref:Uncharacterized protein n=1 Tax=Alligator mississippiensis TaxID=8496 RepID=A0A151M063_ALLMI|nr:hypothetical protein Y1Q_0011519 [Alligator mississippiensis]
MLLLFTCHQFSSPVATEDPKFGSDQWSEEKVVQYSCPGSLSYTSAAGLAAMLTSSLCAIQSKEKGIRLCKDHMQWSQEEERAREKVAENSLVKVQLEDQDEILDVILLVFVLSAIHPDRLQGVVNRLTKLLKPGGMLLFQDYGRYDTTQLSLKTATVGQRILMSKEMVPELIYLPKSCCIWL